MKATDVTSIPPERSGSSVLPLLIKKSNWHLNIKFICIEGVTQVRLLGAGFTLEDVVKIQNRYLGFLL